MPIDQVILCLAVYYKGKNQSCPQEIHILEVRNQISAFESQGRVIFKENSAKEVRD